MASIETDELPILSVLDYFQTQFHLIVPLKGEVQTLRLKLVILNAILSDERQQHVEDGNLKALVTRLSYALFYGCMELGGLWSDFNKIISMGRWCLPMNLDGLISSMLERFEALEPDIQELYTLISKSSRCKVEMTDESVIKHLNSLLRNIGLLQRLMADRINPFEEEVEAVQKGLRFLKSFLAFAASTSGKLGKLKDLLIHAEIVGNDTACLLYLCCANDKVDDQMCSWVKLELLNQAQKIRPAQVEVRNIYINALKSLSPATCIAKTAELVWGFIDSLRENLSELSENDPGFSVSSKDQLLDLHEQLRFLECLVVDLPGKEHADQKIKDLYEQNFILIKRAACLIFSFYDDENDDLASQRKFLALNFLPKLKTAKEEARQLYERLVPKSLRSNFPRTNAPAFISSLLRNLKQLLSSKGDSVAPLKHHIEVVLEELQSLKDDLSKITRKCSEHEELECHWTRFTDVAYQTEHVIDLFLVSDDGIWLHKLGMFDIIEEIKAIRAGLTPLRRKVTDESKMLQNFSSLPDQISVQTSAKDESVVFEPEFEKVMVQLTNGLGKLQVLSIVGMPGIGKTTLANSVYQHDLVACHFHVRASCCVTQSYDTKRLLLELLKQVTDQPFDHGNEDLDHKLYQSLRGRRYLIFLDDIWDPELLNNMRHTFPDDENGSRIMLTSRLDTIGSQFGGESTAYCLSPLSDDMSWEMLQSKVFGKESCPEGLEEVGQGIAIGCRGLPLTIDLIAGVLRGMERKQDCWLQLAEILFTEATADPQKRCLEVLEISYNHLPHYLKPCFLYFGGFPQHMFIPAGRLELIWMAEGFVQLPENDERRLEDVAQTYLDQLISRSLVMVTLRGSLGRVKVAQIHDLLHEFAIVKATKEGFLLPIDGYSDFSTSSTSGYPWFEQYRLCIYPDYREQFFFSKPSGPRVRSLVFPYYLDRLITTDNEVFDYPINLSNFRMLRVFDLPDINIKQIPSSLLQLIHVRFLGIRNCGREVFSAILHRLQNLETLIIMFGIQGGVNLSPKDIENMARLRFLRHFEVCGFSFPRISQQVLEKQKAIPFDNLQYLSAPLLCSGKGNHEKIMRGMTNLRKLKCSIASSRDQNNSLLNLEFLLNLESVSILGQMDREYHTSMFSFPPYLKKLTLKFLNLPWTNISALSKLEHLEILKLQFSKSSTEIWDMMEFEQQFPKLKYLQLFFLNIKVWNASVENIPLLERLQVTYCEDLEELPSCLADIPTLQEIILFRCCNSLAISADEIQEQQVEQGNEQLVVRKMHIIQEDLEDLAEDLNDGESGPQNEEIFLTRVNKIMNSDHDRS